MKVIQLLPELNSGGVERGVLEVGKFLARNGHESVVVSTGGRLCERLIAEGSRHIQLEVSRKRLSTLRWVPALRDVFLKEAPDIVHARSRVPAWLTWLAWRKMAPQTRPKFITTIHGYYSVNAYSAIMARGERVICVSNGLRDYALENYKQVDPEKLTVIHRGVDLQTLTPNFRPTDAWLQSWRQDFPQLNGKRLITLPARLTRWKGQLKFVEMMARLKSRVPDAHGLIVGEINPKKRAFADELERAIDGSQLRDNVSILGHRTDIQEILAISDAVVSCSTDPEAFGRVTLEALALGRPVVGFNHGGVAEQLNHALPGGLVPVGDTRRMAEILASWVQSPPPIGDLAPFDLNVMLHRILDVYQTALQ